MSSSLGHTELAPGQDLAHLLPPSWKADVTRWFAEDTPSFDWAGFVVGEEEQEAFLWGKSEVGCRAKGLLMCRVCSLAFRSSMKCSSRLTARRLRVPGSADISVEWLMPEGSAIAADSKTKVAIVRGKARQLLLGERVALNTLARCSGIATVYVAFSCHADGQVSPLQRRRPC